MAVTTTTLTLKTIMITSWKFSPGGNKQAQANINSEKNNNEIKVLNSGAIKTSAALDAHPTPPSLGLPLKFSGSSSGRTPPFQYSAGFAATILVLFCDVSKTTKVSNWKVKKGQRMR